MSRFLRFILAGCVGALIGWLLLEPWKAQFGPTRESLLLYAVSLGIVLALVLEKIIHARKFKFILTTLKDWRLFVIPIIGVLLIQVLFSESGGKRAYQDERTEERILLLDTSSSMDGDPLVELKRAVREYLSLLEEANSSDLVGAVSFSSGAQTIAHPQRDYTGLSRRISSLRSGGGTDMLAGFQTALNTFTAEGNYPKEIILVSDGLPNEPEAVSGFVGSFEGIPVYSIGVGGGYDAAFLQNVAGTTSGQFFAADDISDLAGVFEEIASQGITQVASDQAAGLPFWKRLLGWSLLGLILGLTIGVGNKRKEMIRIGALGGFLGGVLGSFFFVLIDLLNLGAGAVARGVGFVVLGLCIGLTIYTVNEIYSRLKGSSTGHVRSDTLKSIRKEK